MPRQSDAREKMIQAMGHLLRGRGYCGTGLADVLAESGAPRGSLYYHFPGGKEELAGAALREAGSRFGRGIERGLASAPTTAEALGLMMAAMARGLEQSGYREGCPVATTALEAAAESDRIAEVAGRTFAEWERLFARKLEGDGFPEQESARLATLCLAALEGGLLLARASRSPRPLLDVGEALAPMLRRDRER